MMPLCFAFVEDGGGVAAVDIELMEHIEDVVIAQIHVAQFFHSYPLGLQAFFICLDISTIEKKDQK